MKKKILGIILLVCAFGMWTLYLLGLKGIIPATIAIALTTIGAGIYSEGKQETQLSLESKLSNSKKPPILWLRSFERDGHPLRFNFFSIKTITRHLFLHPDFYSFGPMAGIYSEFECQLVKRLDNIGPVVALGKPGEKLPPIGASRAYYAHSDWQEEVSNLIAKSQKIVLILDFSKSIRWELNEVNMRGKLKDLVIIFDEKRVDWKENYKELQQEFKFLPIDISEDIIAIAFKDEWSNYTLKEASPNLDSIDKIELLFNFIETGTPKPAKHRLPMIFLGKVFNFKTLIILPIILFLLYQPYKRMKDNEEQERSRKEEDEKFELMIQKANNQNLDTIAQPNK